MIQVSVREASEDVLRRGGAGGRGEERGEWRGVGEPGAVRSKRRAEAVDAGQRGVGDARIQHALAGADGEGDARADEFTGVTVPVLRR